MDIRTKQRAVVDALEDVKGRDIMVFNTARMPSMFERVVIASGDSNRQVKALADHVQERIQELGSRVYGVEGEDDGEWVLVDLGDVVVHIMHPTVREFYNLEEVWGGKPVHLATGRQAREEERRSPRRSVPRLSVLAVSARLPGWAEAACADMPKRMPKGYEVARVAVKHDRRLAPRCPRGARLVALDERGKDCTHARSSPGCSKSETAFVIGGPDGLAAE